ncbi:tyrosine-type recombinase/integrase [Nocardia sp. NPDC051052]|uniref:tyrosine-type recombinase/integrase n=1 Tax=Nocardia sp. NPDC051052 TaxID=3364322 RepID=UPI0037B4D2B0
MTRRGQGEGTLYHRSDGRWEGAAYLPTASGRIRRLRVYGKTRKEASEKLTMSLADTKRGIPLPEQSWKVGAYLDYFMRDIAPKTLRPTTINTYGNVIQGHLKPMLGSHSLTRLTVTGLQEVFDQRIAHGMSLPTAVHVRIVLSAALTRAMREDLVVRNVARLVVLPRYDRKEIVPWTIDEVARFLAVAKSHRMYPAFLLLSLYGLRRGEALGLRWGDIDWDHDVLRIRQQFQVIRGQNYIGPVKTAKGKRDLPLLAFVRQALNQYQIDIEDQHIHPARDSLVFVDDDGRPFGPSNFYFLFQKLSKKAGLRRIRLHDLRHTVATLLKNSHVPDRDIQLILGHSRVTTTQEIYEHGDGEAQQLALSRIEDALLGAGNSGGSRQMQPSNVDLVVPKRAFQQRQNADLRIYADKFSTKMDHLRRDPASTPVLEELRARTNTHILGCVAVKSSRQINDGNLVLWEWVPLLSALTPIVTPFTNSPLRSDHSD